MSVPDPGPFAIAGSRYVLFQVKPQTCFDGRYTKSRIVLCHRPSGFLRYDNAAFPTFINSRNGIALRQSISHIRFFQRGSTFPCLSVFKMPEVGDFLPELICLGVDALVCAGIYHAYSSVSGVIKAGCS